MSAPHRIAQALGELRQAISYEKATTSREERITIMESAARAMGMTAVDHAPESLTKYLTLFHLCDFLFEKDPNNDEQPIRCSIKWPGGYTFSSVGVDHNEALDAAVAYFVRQMTTAFQHMTPDQKEALFNGEQKPETKAPIAPKKNVGQKQKTNVEGHEFESKADAIRWVLEQAKYWGYDDLKVANLVGCSTVHVKKIRQEVIRQAVST